MSTHILIVEDEEDIARLIARTLEKEGIKSTIVTNLAQAQGFLTRQEPDLIILDLMLPDGDGLDLCKELRFREEKEIPVVVVTAKGEEVDRILGFEMGADDYIVKPFSPRELLLRIKAILRRLQKPPEPSQILKFEFLEIDPHKIQVRIKGESVKLTRTEFNLLLALAEARGKVLSREVLLDKVWGYTFEGYARTVDTHIRRLRKKLGPAAKFIETVWGIGYRFRS